MRQLFLFIGTRAVRESNMPLCDCFFKFVHAKKENELLVTMEGPTYGFGSTSV